MVENLNELHKINSKYAGDFTKQKFKLTWKNVFLSKFTDPKILNWIEISNRKELNRDLLLSSLEKLTYLIQRTEFINTDYSLLHTDFNQRNLFIDIKNKKIAGIIDWEESLFGDPIYDFARIRMLFWHYNLNTEAIKKYFNVMNFNEKEKSLENLYFISRIIEYLAYYSEEDNDFNRNRIQLHESFLKDLNWRTL